MSNWMRAALSRTSHPSVSPREEDADLVARAKADRQAFAPLYVRYVDTVYRYCYRRLGSSEAAEDATSEVFYKALAALHNYRDGSFPAWLMTIARNVVIDGFRQRRPEEPLGPDSEPPDMAATPEEIALASEEGRSLRALLARLPEDQRRVLELRLAGLTGLEIATVLGRSLGSVKMLQFRAVERLRVLLGVQMDAEEAHHGRI